jgi:D-arabinose 1-dehydrogenase-like Zn-dependent alcohol dehydrogenase
VGIVAGYRLHAWGADPRWESFEVPAPRQGEVLLEVEACGGRLCLLTTFPGARLDVDPRRLVFRESAIVGSRYASRAELLQAAAMVATGTVRPVVGAAAAPGGVMELHRALRAGTLRGRGALVWSG